MWAASNRRMLPAARKGMWMVPAVSAKNRSHTQLISAEPRARLSAQPSQVSVLILSCHSHCTHNTPLLPLPESFPTWSSSLLCASFLAADPSRGQASPSCRPQEWWLIPQLTPSPQIRSHEGGCSSAAFLVPVSWEQLYRRDAENACETPRKRY